MKYYDRVRHLIEGETDPIAVMATVACELHHAFDTSTGPVSTGWSSRGS